MEEIFTTLLISAICIVLCIANWVFKRYRSHGLFKRYSIPGPEPDFFGGNMYHLQTESVPSSAIQLWIEKYGNLFGYYMGDSPTLIVKDLEMLKQIMIKDFYIFGNRPPFPIDIEFASKTLIALKGQRWKEVRSLLTPTFSAAKIKLMFGIVNKKVDITVAEVAKKAETKEMFDIYDLLLGLTLDVIADCALAMKTQCQTNFNDKFYESVREYFSFSYNKVVELAIMFPFISRVISFVMKFKRMGKMTSIIVDNVTKVIKERKENSELKCMDVLQFMIDQDENGGVPKMTDEEIVANAIVFLLGGTETTATALVFTFYLLVTHPNIQERLQEEIDSVEDCSYDTIKSLQYLDQVFNESLRLYPPVIYFVSRKCCQDHKIGKFTIPKGAGVTIPIWEIHHDPDLWPEPWKFDPDRFSSENKESIKSLSFLPFGVGRRNCIGSRFALFEAKLAIYRLFKEFKFVTCEKTKFPLKLKCPLIVIKPANGVWIRAISRTKNAI